MMLTESACDHSKSQPRQQEEIMQLRTKVVGAAGIAVLVAAGSAAFTATGLSTTGNAASPQFAGGTIT